MGPFLAMLLAADAEGSTAGFGRLEGVVTSPVDGRGLPNVVVMVRPAPVGGMRTVTPGAQPKNPEAGGDEAPGGSSGRVDTTGRDGTFSFEELPPGLYSLDVIGESPVGDSPSEGLQRVWTQISSVIVVPGLTTTERVTLLGPPARELPEPTEAAPGT